MARTGPWKRFSSPGKGGLVSTSHVIRPPGARCWAHWRKLATTSVDRLKGKHLEAEDFDKLFSDDPAKDLLLWMSDPGAMRSGWNTGRWAAVQVALQVRLQVRPRQGRRAGWCGAAGKAGRTLGHGMGAIHGVAGSVFRRAGAVAQSHATRVVR